MNKRIFGEYKGPPGLGKAIVTYVSRDEIFQIEYYDEDGAHFYTEPFSNSTLTEVQAIAQAWTIGKHLLEE